MNTRHFIITGIGLALLAGGCASSSPFDTQPARRRFEISPLGASEPDSDVTISRPLQFAGAGSPTDVPAPGEVNPQCVAGRDAARLDPKRPPGTRRRSGGPAGVGCAARRRPRIIRHQMAQSRPRLAFDRATRSSTRRGGAGATCGAGCPRCPRRRHPPPGRGQPQCRQCGDADRPPAARFAAPGRAIRICCSNPISGSPASVVRRLRTSGRRHGYGAEHPRRPGTKVRPANARLPGRRVGPSR